MIVRDRGRVYRILPFEFFVGDSHIIKIQQQAVIRFPSHPIGFQNLRNVKKLFRIRIRRRVQYRYRREVYSVQQDCRIKSSPG